MRKIVTMMQPFDLLQNVIVYEDGNKLAVEQIETSTFVDGALNLVKKFNAKEINLGGARRYATRIGEQLKESAMTQYNINDLVINII